jgi:hypothetical protein
MADVIARGRDVPTVRRNGSDGGGLSASCRSGRHEGARCTVVGRSLGPRTPRRHIDAPGRARHHDDLGEWSGRGHCRARRQPKSEASQNDAQCAQGSPSRRAHRLESKEAAKLRNPS